jgi:hypothetical protein
VGQRLDLFVGDQQLVNPHPAGVTHVATGAAADIATFTSGRGSALKDHLVKNGINADRINVRAMTTTDPINPPPIRKGAKGKRYVGPVYVVVTSI